jgi:hypothetical protein
MNSVVEDITVQLIEVAPEPKVPNSCTDWPVMNGWNAAVCALADAGRNE